MSTGIESGVIRTDGADIYYERRGSGPALLLVPGGVADAGSYSVIADLLADEYTVLTYDRRGNSRSRIRGGDSTLRMEQQSRDAIAVISHNGFRDALVFGSSAGAVIGLDLAARFPESVAGLVAHEPPVFRVLPDAPRLAAFFDEVERIRVREGVWPAYVWFMAVNSRTGPPLVLRSRVVRWLAGRTMRAMIGALSRPQPPRALRSVIRLVRRRRPPVGSAEQMARRRATMVRSMANIEFFVTNETQPVSHYLPDLDALRAGGVPIVLAGGHDSRSLFYCRTGDVLAERLGVDFVEFPGAHVGYLEDAPAFAVTLRKTLAGLHDGPARE